MTPVEFGAPVAVPCAALSAEYNVKPADVKIAPTEAAILRERDAAVNRRVNHEYARGMLGAKAPPPPVEPPPGSPEDIFRKLAK